MPAPLRLLPLPPPQRGLAVVGDAHGVEAICAEGQEDRRAFRVLLVGHHGAARERVGIQRDKERAARLLDAFSGEFDAKPFGIAGDGYFSSRHGRRCGENRVRDEAEETEE